MRAVVYENRGEPLSIREVPTPEPGPGELLLRVRACGVCGSDLHATEHGTVPPGGILGHEFAGEVAALGGDVGDGWKLGDRVFALPLFSCGACPACYRGDTEFCHELRTLGSLMPGDLPGAYAEYVRVSARDSLRLPDSMPFPQAALIEPVSTGLKTFRAMGLRPRGSVLVVGAGPIGLAVALWARFFGAAHVVVSELAAGRRELARRLGATEVIDAGNEDDPVAAFRRVTGRAPDAIVEAVGVPGMIQRCIGWAPARTRIVVAGVCMEPDSIEPVQAILKDLELAFVIGYSIEDCRFTLDMMTAGRIDPSPLITDRISLDELPGAFEALRRPTTQCKVMLEP